MRTVFKPQRHAPLPSPAHHTVAPSPAGTLPHEKAKIHMGAMYGSSTLRGMEQERDNQPNDHGGLQPAALHARFYIGSLVGLIWSICFVSVAIPAWLIMVPGEPNATVPLGQRIFQAFAFLSLAGVLGGPLVSALSLARIRRSAGQLTGLRTATAGLWLPPLTIAAAVIFTLLAYFIHTLIEDRGLTRTLIEDRGLTHTLQLFAAGFVLVSTVVVLWQMVRRAGRAELH